MASSGAALPPGQRSQVRAAPGAPVRASRAAPTAARALRVVEVVSERPERPWTLAELQRHLGYSHGNLHAILATLVAMGYLRRDDATRSYGLGPALLGLGAAARRAHPEVELALPHLEHLAAELGTEAHAATRVGQTVLVVARVGPELPDGGGVVVGERIPLTPPVGSTLMAFAPAAELEAYLATAAGTWTAAEVEAHRARLAEVRARGWSVHVDPGPLQALSERATALVQDGVDDVDAALTHLVHELGPSGYLADGDGARPGQAVQLSAPVFGPDAAVALSVGVAFAAARTGADPAVVGRAPGLVVAAADAVTAALGGRRPPGAPDPDLDPGADAG